MTTEQDASRRGRRTQQLIVESTLSLIAERGWDKTTGQEITRRVDVGRSTFYSHYETKEDLILSGLTSMIELLEQSGRPLSHAWMIHLETNSTAIRNALRAEGRSKVIELMGQALSKRFEDRLSQGDSRSATVPIEVEAKFLAAGLVGLVGWWVENGFPVTHLFVTEPRRCQRNDFGQPYSHRLPRTYRFKRHGALGPQRFRCGR